MNTKKQFDVSIPPFTVKENDLAMNDQVINYWYSFLTVLDAHQDNKGQKAVIYMIDTARDFDHPDLPAPPFKNDSVGTGKGADPHGHGHMFVGISSAINSTTGIIGIAPESIPIPSRGIDKEGEGQWEQIIDAVKWCRDNYRQYYQDTHIGIINMSFIGNSGSDTFRLELEECVKAGMIPISTCTAYPGKWSDLCITGSAIGMDNKSAWFIPDDIAGDTASCKVNISTTNNKQGYNYVKGSSFNGAILAGLAALIVTRHYDAFKGAGEKAKKLLEIFLKKSTNDLDENSTTGKVKCK